jgi:hypothetical protein
MCWAQAPTHRVVRTGWRMDQTAASTTWAPTCSLHVTHGLKHEMSLPRAVSSAAPLLTHLLCTTPLQVSLADAGAPTCQVLSVSPASLAGDSPPADLAVLAPVLVTAPGTLQRHVAVALGIAAASQADIHATSHAAIAAAAAEVAADYSPEACAAADAAVAAAQPGLWQLLGAAVGVAAAGGHQVWHLPLDFFFCVAEQQEYDQVAAFFAEYLQAQGRLRQKVGSGSMNACMHACMNA